MRFDYETYLRDGLLPKIDRTTMLVSLEARAPFLDPALVRFAFALPTRCKVRGFTTKWLLKRAARKWLPRSVIRRRKHGLSVPISHLMNGALRPEVDRLLAPPVLARQGLLNPGAVGQLLSELRGGNPAVARGVWALVVLQRWLEKWSQDFEIRGPRGCCPAPQETIASRTPNTRSRYPGAPMTREDALALMHEYTPSDALRKHMYAVEAAMRAYARKQGEDEDAWGMVGLLHDFDYERYPNASRSPTEEHPSHGVGLLRQRGFPEPMARAILGHASYTGVPRETAMAKTLFAVDELCGFLVACALVRPSRSLQDLEVSSVKKKLKDKAFARGVNREEVHQGAAELGVPLDDHIQFVLGALRPVERTLGLGGA
jgi:putative nucleotidyltransferase with HDIG domain